jgi:nucleoside-diphosphate-sugar epimerase
MRLARRTSTILQRRLSSSAASRSVAVTGASGYIGSYVCAELLERGYSVRAMVRGSSSNPDKGAHLTALPGGRLTLVDGDLECQPSLVAAFAGADAVIHTAAAVELSARESIITASVDGVKNVLSAVDACASVQAFVHTSSVAAVQRYDKDPDHIFSEADWNGWSSLANGDAYGTAKTQAERVVQAHFRGDPRHSACLNPAVVIGPVMTKAHTKASPVFIREIIFGNPVLTFPSHYVDVRDVATAHVNALETREANGGRFLLAPGSCCDVRELATVARAAFPAWRFDAKPKVPPALVKYLLAPLSTLPIVGRFVLSEFERKAFVTPISFDSSAATATLGVAFRPLDETVLSAVTSMVDGGFAQPRARAAGEVY